MEIQNSGGWKSKIRVSAGSTSLASRWPLSHWALVWSLPHTGVRVLGTWASSSQKDTRRTEAGPTFAASFPLNHLLEGRLQTWAHSEMPGARAQCMNLRGHKSAHHPICEQLPQIFISPCQCNSVLLEYSFLLERVIYRPV